MGNKVDLNHIFVAMIDLIGNKLKWNEFTEYNNWIIGVTLELNNLLLDDTGR